MRQDRDLIHHGGKTKTLPLFQGFSLQKIIHLPLKGKELFSRHLEKLAPIILSYAQLLQGQLCNHSGCLQGVDPQTGTTLNRSLIEIGRCCWHTI